MAIWQFYLAVIPKKGLQLENKDIPATLPVGAKDGYFVSNAEKYWKLAEVASDEIIQMVDLLIPRAKWGDNVSLYSWKFYSETTDNDASIVTDRHLIREFSFRADLREKDLKFLREMLALAEKYDCLLMDRKGNLAEPVFRKVAELIGQSNAYHYLQNPLRFLEGIVKRSNEGEIKE